MSIGDEYFSKSQRTMRWLLIVVNLQVAKTHAENCQVTNFSLDCVHWETEFSDESLEF
jgi:hypothetical protein